MKKIFIACAALIALASCGLKEEFQPVFSGKPQNPQPYRYYDDSDFANIITIADLVSGYKPCYPVTYLDETVIKGRITTTDQPGNFYKSFYIQDETGGIEIKVGKNSLYNDYLEGQTVYVNLEGLTLGMYGYKTGNYGGIGMAQIGFFNPNHQPGKTKKENSDEEKGTVQYETLYLEIPVLIDTHIFRGDPDDIQKVEPAVIRESMLPNLKSDTQATNRYVGAMVELDNLSYGNEIFCMLYVDSKKNHLKYWNRIFLSADNNPSNPTAGITTWAMSKEKMTEYVCSGDWDIYKVGSGNNYAKNENGEDLTIGDLKGDGTYPGLEKAAYSVTHYFKFGNKDIQIRTSGFCKFCDIEIPEDVLDGSRSINAKGILSLYEGGYQLTVNSLRDITYSDGSPLYK